LCEESFIRKDVAQIALIGSGIIGTATAFALQDAGFSVLVIEPEEPGAGTASGSAGFLHDSEIFPLAHPQLLKELPRLLLDPLGPLVFRFSYLPQLAGWGIRFLRAMRQTEIERAIEALGSLNRFAIDSLLTLAQNAGAQELIVHGGGMKIARDPKTLEGFEEELARLSRAGIPARSVDARELHELEPALAPEIAGAMLFPNSAHCTDPQRFGELLAARVAARGNILRARARSLISMPNGTWWIDVSRNGSSERIEAERVVVTAGYASAQLLRPLGYRAPVASARGYHLMIREPGVELKRPMIFHEPHFGATPMRGGLRLAGTMEFASSGAPPDFRRAEMLFRLARRYIPGLECKGATAWMGVRPSMPDSLPAIGRANRHENLFYCFGHGHLGLTQAAISARCVADLVSGTAPPLDLAPFDLDRFA
jgi:glycine/D-amino acid oxidase-like deaminating enzyme